jgi:hypothetical protein
MDHFYIEVIGWIGTALLVFSYLCSTRLSLHYLAFISTALKLYYTYERQVWPLFVNWAILIVVHLFKIVSLHRRPDEKAKTPPS